MRQGRTVGEAKRVGVHCCSRETSLRDAAQLILEKDISALVVLDETKSLAGVLSRTDLLRAYVETEGWALQPVSAYMSTEVVTVSPQTPLAEVADLLLTHHIHRVVVVRHENGRLRPVAVVSDGDFVYHMIKHP